MFEVEQLDRHPKTEFPTEAVFGPTDETVLRLITCDGSFDEAQRSYRDNLIAHATLREVIPPT